MFSSLCSLSEALSRSLLNFLSAADAVERKLHNLSEDITAQLQSLNTAESHLKEGQQHNALMHKLIQGATAKLQEREVSSVEDLVPLNKKSTLLLLLLLPLNVAKRPQTTPLL